MRGPARLPTTVAPPMPTRAPFLLLLRLVLSTVINQKMWNTTQRKKKTPPKMTKLFIFWLITMTAVVVGRSYRGSLVILGGGFFYSVVFHIFWLITVESTSRSSKRKGALRSTVWHRTQVFPPAHLSLLPMTNMVPNICLVHPCQIVWQNYQESLRCLFIEIFVNHKLKVFMKSVMAGKRSIKKCSCPLPAKCCSKLKHNTPGMQQ